MASLRPRCDYWGRAVDAKNRTFKKKHLDSKAPSMGYILKVATRSGMV